MKTLVHICLLFGIVLGFLEPDLADTDTRDLITANQIALY